MNRQTRRAVSCYLRACRYGVAYLMGPRELPEWAGPRIVAYRAAVGPLDGQADTKSRIGRLAARLGPLAGSWRGPPMIN